MGKSSFGQNQSWQMHVLMLVEAMNVPRSREFWRLNKQNATIPSGLDAKEGLGLDHPNDMTAFWAGKIATSK
jgi:hypothetical protein